MDLPSVTELKQAAESGQRITPEDVSAISHAESVLTGRGPVRGGPAGKYIRSHLEATALTQRISYGTESRHASD